MGVFSSILASLFISAAIQGAEEVNETPAEPILRIAPAYPEACAPADRQAVKPQTIIVLFDVTKDGMTENVRITESSDDCFNNVAMAAVRSWNYEPRMIDGKARDQIDTETTFTFINETPAEPILRIAPAYPEACAPADRQVVKPQTVSMLFDVTKDGITENVRITESSDDCFNDVVLATVRSWNYEPRMVGGRARAQIDTETTFTFIFDGETQAVDFDARVLYREPPEYPDRCQRSAGEKDAIMVEFDIDIEGIPQNIKVIDSTNACFNSASKDAVEKWRYRPKTVSGKPVIRTGVVTTIEFMLSRRSALGYEFRRSVNSQLRRSRRFLVRGEYDKAMEVLEKLEAKKGDSFSRSELSVFHRFRASVFIETKEYARALDDLRIVHNMGLGNQANEGVGNMIVQLEAVLAAKQSDASQAEGDEESPE